MAARRGCEFVNQLGEDQMTAEIIQFPARGVFVSENSVRRKMFGALIPSDDGQERYVPADAEESAEWLQAGYTIISI